MRYLKLVSFFVHFVCNTLPSVHALPMPMDQALSAGDMTIGMVFPTFIPNIKLPGGGALPSGVPNPGTVTESHGIAGAPKVPGTSGISGLPGVPNLGAVPGLGGLTGSGLGGGLPFVSTVKDSTKAILAPGLGSIKKPTRRSPDPGHGNARLQPRQFHNADFSAAASPNGTVPQLPSPSASDAPATAGKHDINHAARALNDLATAYPDGTGTTAFSKRATTKSRDRSSRKNSSSDHKRPTRPTRPEHKQASEHTHSAAAKDAPSTSSSSSSGPAAGFANSLKTLGSVPQLVSPAVNAVPALPDTPLTAADTTPVVDAADTTDLQTAPKAPIPAEEKQPAPGTNPGAYPNAPGYHQPPPPAPATENASVSAATKPKSKRHSLVFDTDPLLPPSDDTAAKKDPAMGLLDIDSNQKAPPPPASPSLPAKQASITPAPKSTNAPSTSTVSLYQPSEPGYQGAAYATPTPTSR